MSSADHAAAPEVGDHAPGLYVHVPFCSAICPYCDFAVLTATTGRRAELAADIDSEAALVAHTWLERTEHTPLDTIYIGGGTPTLLAPQAIPSLLGSARRHLAVVNDPWIFVEANPEDADRRRLEELRECGVRTLSLGVQGFDDRRLAFLGRRHRGADSRRAVDTARSVGFETVSIDLIFGLPDDDPASFEVELRAAAALEPDHISCYQLSMPDGTPFARRLARGDLTELPDDDQAELFELAHRLLPDSGYHAYEVSNFARAPHHQSRHNRKYWDHTPYLGLGPAAHSYAAGRRWWNHRDLATYTDKVRTGRSPIDSEETLTERTLAVEAVMLGLRTVAGLDLERLRSRYRVDLLAVAARQIETYTNAGLTVLDGGRLRPTVRGLARADGLATALAAALDRDAPE